MNKTIIFVELFLTIAFAWSMEQSNYVNEPLYDSKLRMIKGGLTNSDIQKFKKYGNVLRSYLNLKNSCKSNKDKQLLFLKLTSFFWQDPKIDFLNKDVDNNDILNDSLEKELTDSKRFFLEELCSYTDYYFICEIKEGARIYSIFNHKYAKFFMKIRELPERKAYIEKNKKILSLLSGPSDNEIINQFIQPVVFIKNVINPISNNDIAIKKAFFETYLNDFLENASCLLGYCYFFNSLSARIFADKEFLKSVINTSTKKPNSCKIIVDELIDETDYLSLLLKATYYKQAQYLIEKMMQDEDLKNTIKSVLKGEDGFSNNNQVIFKIWELYQNDELALNNILKLFDKEDRSLIKNNIKTVTLY